MSTATTSRWARWAGPARWAGLLGAVLVTVSPFMAWAYRSTALDDMTYWGAPSVLQWLGFVLGALLLACLLGPLVLTRPKTARARKHVNLGRGAKAAAVASLAYLATVGISIALALGGLVALEPGLWVGLAGAALATAATRLLPPGHEPRLRFLPTPAWVQILGIVGSLTLVLLVAAYGLGLDDPGSFV